MRNAFDAPYSVCPAGAGTRPASEATLMMRP